MNEPKLKFTSTSLSTVLKRLRADRALLVTDTFSRPLVSSFGDSVVITTNTKRHLNRLLSEFSHQKYDFIVAVGGCTALDAGRYFAQRSQKLLFIVPTILSTSCISVDRSVIHAQGRYFSIKTTLPHTVYISIPTILQGDPLIVRKWIGSGLGDLFANISAVLEQEYERESNFRNVSSDSVNAQARLSFEALAWINSWTHFRLDKIVVKRTARFSHLSSLSVIRKGNSKLSAGSEHALYYQLLINERYNHELTTHGQLVSIGTLFIAYMYGKSTGFMSLFCDLRNAYKKIGLPTIYDELESISVRRSHLVKAISQVGKHSQLYGRLVAPQSTKILDAVYGYSPIEKISTH